MFQFVGLDAFSGIGALRSAPSTVNNISSATLSNAIFDHFTIGHSILSYGDSVKPLAWDYDTVLNASFDGTAGAGNLDYMVGQISGVKIKRRIKGTFDWITLKYIPIENVDSLVFTFNDFLNAYGVEYDYALVPVSGGIEGDYIIDSIMSKFTGVFVGDAEQSFKFMYDVSYGSNARNQQIGVFQTLGKKYPIYVANGDLSYESGSVSGTVLNNDFEVNATIDKVEIAKKKNAIKDFLTNRKPKVLKDENGNLWLVIIVDSVPVTYKQGSFMSIPQIGFNWMEIGDANDQESLYEAGMTNVPVD